MAPLIVEMWSEAVGEVETAIWCDPCALPSTIRVKIALGMGSGLSARHVGTVLYEECQSCGRRRTKPVPFGGRPGRAGA